MFSGNSTINFKSDSPKAGVFDLIQQNLESAFGGVDISERGQIKINARRFDGFGFEAVIEGVVKEKEGRYTVDIIYETNTTFMFWVAFAVGILIWFSGLLLFLLPYNGKNTIQKKTDKVLEAIRYELV